MPLTLEQARRVIPADVSDDELQMVVDGVNQEMDLIGGTEKTTNAMFRSNIALQVVKLDIQWNGLSSQSISGDSVSMVDYPKVRNELIGRVCIA